MRVALITRYFDGTNAGIGRVSSELLKGLLNRGYETIPICTTTKSLQGYMAYSVFNLNLEMPDNADVYHSVTPIESLWIPKDNAVATILDLIPILHPEKCGAGIGYNKLLNKVGTSYFEFCVKQAVKARFITTIAESTRQEICCLFDVSPEKVKVIRPGISKDLKPAFYPLIKGNVFGYLGQLDRRKRVDLLIQAFLESASPDSKLLIAGTGRDAEKLKAMSIWDRRIIFLGFIDDSELSGFYNSLDYFVFPTMVEGYGLPIVESLACGTPVVTLSDSCIPHEVKDRTIVLNNLNNLFKNPDFYNQDEATLKANVDWAKGHSWDTYVEQHIELYKEVLNG